MGEDQADHKGQRTQTNQIIQAIQEPPPQPLLAVLKKRRDFVFVQKTGKRWVSSTLVLQVADVHPMLATFPSPEKSKGRGNGKGMIYLGFTVSKRVVRLAVRRNRIRRRLRALARTVLPLYAQPDRCYVLIGKAEALEADFAQLQRDLRWCLKRLGCVRDKEA